MADGAGSTIIRTTKATVAIITAAWRSLTEPIFIIVLS
jgi:hypothetical protein